MLRLASQLLLSSQIYPPFPLFNQRLIELAGVKSEQQSEKEPQAI